MIFSSLLFIFAFLPIVWVIFHCLKSKYVTSSKIFLIVASLFFYGFWKLSYLPILVASILVNFLLAFLILYSPFFKKHIKPKFYLVFGIVFNLALLGYFKYTNFIIENINIFSNTYIDFEPILLPLALSFVTFQQIAFLLDCYHQTKDNKNNFNLNFLDYALFISFFPQLIAGPIVHHKEMMPQFSHLKSGILWDYVAKGIFIFCIGLFKKIVIADRFANCANAGFKYVEAGNIFFNITEAWATSLSYTFQLYFDFSGYCDMAIGLGLMFGIMLPINFNSPYQSLNISEFWRRWHITLGRFFKECLYIPLGGNKVNKLLECRNLFIVAFLSGIWHGAGWGFIIWGILHGCAMIIHRIYSWNFKSFIQKNKNKKIYKFFCWFLTFNFINIAWVFFRAENIQAAFSILKSMFGLALIPMPTEWHLLFPHIHSANYAPGRFIFFLILITMLCVISKNSIQKLKNFKPHNFYLVFSIILFIWSFRNLLLQSSYTAFIYFNF